VRSHVRRRGETFHEFAQRIAYWFIAPLISAKWSGLFGAFGGAISATGTLSRSHSVCSSVISLTSVSALLPPSVPLQLEQVKQHGPTLTLTVSSTQGTRACPVCGQDSSSVHSRYERCLADLPVQGVLLRFRIGVRRFYCRVRDCIRQVFCERLEGLARSYARQTARFNTCLELIAHALGGNAGARLAERLSLPASATLLLRRLRQLTVPSSSSPRVVGIDDWAYKRGQRYGTILVDLERHCVVDLLPDRTTDTVAAWFKKQPKVEVVSRDRAGAYAEATRQGAPQAQQVADRWHLLQNLTEAVQRVVERHYPHLREIAQQTAEETGEQQQTEAAGRTVVPPSAAEQLRQARQERRQLRCAEVLRLHQQGDSIQSIARQLRMHRRLVRQYTRLGAVPPRTPHPRRSSELDAYAGYLAQRWQEGCRNGTQLWRELRERGFRGSSRRVRQWIAQYHRPNSKRGSQQSTAAPLLPSPRQVTWILLQGPRPADEQAEGWIERFRQHVPELHLAAQLATEFAALLREKRSDELSAWMDRAAQSPLASFVAGLRRDFTAVQAAFASPWSQGQVEGQVNRLKMLKRQMYGRASLPLLRSRVLAAPNPEQRIPSIAS
jgi:transposase